MGRIQVLSVNISEKKGTIKKPVDQIELNEMGVVSDAHAGDWHRQVSLLGKESIDKFSAEAKREIAYGEFAENITTEGILLYECHPLDRFKIGDTELEVTQIGKKCHGSSCAIFQEVGNCVMPKEGIFARVIKSGTVKPGDEFIYIPGKLTVKIITLSDRASKGIYKDKSGPRLNQILTDFLKKEKWPVEIESVIIPDDEEQLGKLLDESIKQGIDFVFTTGGTGISQRDITIDVVKDRLDKEIPGIMELIRVKYGAVKPNALLSRSVAGVMKQTLIYTLPGSTRAIDEYMDVIKPTLIHSLYMLYALDMH